MLGGAMPAYSDVCRTPRRGGNTCALDTNWRTNPWFWKVEPHRPNP